MFRISNNTIFGTNKINFRVLSTTDLEFRFFYKNSLNFFFANNNLHIYEYDNDRNTSLDSDEMIY